MEGRRDGGVVRDGEMEGWKGGGMEGSGVEGGEKNETKRVGCIEGVRGVRGRRGGRRGVWEGARAERTTRVCEQGSGSTGAGIGAAGLTVRHSYRQRCPSCE